MSLGLAHGMPGTRVWLVLIPLQKSSEPVAGGGIAGGVGCENPGRIISTVVGLPSGAFPGQTGGTCGIIVWGGAFNHCAIFSGAIPVRWRNSAIRRIMSMSIPGFMFFGDNIYGMVGHPPTFHPSTMLHVVVRCRIQRLTIYGPVIGDCLEVSTFDSRSDASTYRFALEKEHREDLVQMFSGRDLGTIHHEFPAYFKNRAPIQI